MAAAVTDTPDAADTVAELLIAPCRDHDAFAPIDGFARKPDETLEIHLSCGCTTTEEALLDGQSLYLQDTDTNE